MLRNADAALSRAKVLGKNRYEVFEAGAQIELLDLYTLISVPHISQIHGFYRARMLSPELNPGEETLEARLFSETEIPWDELAFRTVRQTLEHFFAEAAWGSVSEVFDGDAPHRPEGCVAQAWSVAEVLRCLVVAGHDRDAAADVAADQSSAINRPSSARSVT